MRVSAHMAVDVFLVKLMKIEPLKASSPFCSGRQTKTKPPQSVSFLPFIIVRTTAAPLPVSQQTPPSVCVFLKVPL